MAEAPCSLLRGHSLKRYHMTLFNKVLHTVPAPARIMRPTIALRSSSRTWQMPQRSCDVSSLTSPWIFHQSSTRHSWMNLRW